MNGDSFKRSSLAVMLLNYRRPFNVGPILANIQVALPGAPIFVIDQSERNDLIMAANICWENIWLMRRPNGGCIVRLQIAAALPFESYFVIDDDILIQPEQVSMLVDVYMREPDRIHGGSGQVFLVSDEHVVDKRPIRRSSRAVSALNQLYVLRRDHAIGALALHAQSAAEMGGGSIDDMDDLFLSGASDKAPLCHDVGDLAECPTGANPEIAVWTRPGQGELRLRLADRLAQQGRLHVVDASDPTQVVRPLRQLKGVHTRPDARF